MPVSIPGIGHPQNRGSSGEFFPHIDLDLYTLARIALFVIIMSAIISIVVKIKQNRDKETKEKSEFFSHLLKNHQSSERIDVDT